MLNLMRGIIMSIEYEVRISERQRKLIMRALTTTVANNRRSTSGGLLSDAAPDDWMELIGVFAALNPHMMGWMAPLRHLSAKLLSNRISSEWEPSMGEVTTIGLDLAK